MRLSVLMDDLPIINWHAFEYNIYLWDKKRMKSWTGVEAIPDEVLEYMCRDIEFDFGGNICVIWLDKEY